MSRRTYAEEARARTLDRGPPEARRAPVYTIGQIGPKRKLRPDGSLLCEDVPIARTGELLYRPQDGIPIRPSQKPGSAHVLYVTRDRMALFAPQTLGSAVGAAVTNDHPPQDVDPLNWSTLSKGFVLDAWQGVGEDADVMFADIVITDQGLIHKVNTNQLREVSLGYDAAYEDLGDGRGRQRNIIINHLALVERGRCGPRFAIGDRQTIDEEETTMPRPTEEQGGGARPRNRLQIAQEALAAIASEEEQEQQGVHVHVHMGAEQAATAATRDAGTVDDPADPELAERVSSIEDGLLELRTLMTETLTAVKAGRTTDGATTQQQQQQQEETSEALQPQFQALASQAEILVPGFRVPAFDAKATKTRTIDSMTVVRRGVLSHLANTADGAKLLGQVVDEGFDVAQADPASVSTVFKAAASLKAGLNNRASTGDRMTVPAGAPGIVVAPAGGVKPLTGDDINEMNRKFWAQTTA